MAGTLPNNCTVAELDQALGMRFHPLTGRELHLYSYCKETQRYFSWEKVMGAWTWGEEERVFIERISAGRNMKAGESYPAHWRFDPFTGQGLNNIFQACYEGFCDLD